MTVLLVNPNGSRATTAAMRQAVGRILPDVEGMTFAEMPPMLVEPDVLAAAAERVAELRPAPHVRGLIVSAFGDPGAAALADALAIPVIGIGAASARAARTVGPPFAVATTTPALRAVIDALMEPGGDYLGSFVTNEDPMALVADPVRLDAALIGAIARAEATGAKSVIIGGGPLAAAAHRLQKLVAIPLIDPVECAARELAVRVGRG